MEELRVESSAQILRDNEEIKKLIDLSIVARNEHNELVHIVDLLAVKPRDLKLLRVDVDSKNITVEGFAIDANLFNDYTESKKDEKFFSALKIEKIAAAGNKSPYKTCTIRSAVVGGGT